MLPTRLCAARHGLVAAGGLMLAAAVAAHAYQSETQPSTLPGTQPASRPAAAATTSAPDPATAERAKSTLERVLAKYRGLRTYADRVDVADELVSLLGE